MLYWSVKLSSKEYFLQRLQCQTGLRCAPAPRTRSLLWLISRSKIHSLYYLTSQEATCTMLAPPAYVKKHAILLAQFHISRSEMYHAHSLCICQEGSYAHCTISSLTLTLTLTLTLSRFLSPSPLSPSLCRSSRPAPRGVRACLCACGRARHACSARVQPGESSRSNVRFLLVNRP
jgi:hypothetical protein